MSSWTIISNIGMMKVMPMTTSIYHTRTQELFSHMRWYGNHNSFSQSKSVLLKNLLGKKQHRDPHNLYIAQQCVNFFSNNWASLHCFKVFFGWKKNVYVECKNPSSFCTRGCLEKVYTIELIWCATKWTTCRYVWSHHYGHLWR